MEQFVLPAKSVVYVMDAYCGWCWGFSERLLAFASANRHRVQFSAIGGGLFVGTRVVPISSYSHIPQANALIAQQTGAEFGEAYEELLRSGNMLMDSLDAGAALAALRCQAPDRATEWAHLLQYAFYVQGLSLSRAETIADIAFAHGLDPQEVLRNFADGSAHRQAEADFRLTYHLGVSSFPTLLFVDGDRVHRLPATGATLDTLNAHLDQLLA